MKEKSLELPKSLTTTSVVTDGVPIVTPTLVARPNSILLEQKTQEGKQNLRSWTAVIDAGGKSIDSASEL